MKTTIALYLTLLFPLLLLAEGTRELAPNDSININGNVTTDIAALHINSPNYNYFASFDNSDPNSRLNIHISDPSVECIHLGFSIGEPNGGNTIVDYEYRVLDPSGAVVFGPVLVNAATANINGWSDAHTGPSDIYGPSGYIPVKVTSADLQSQGWTGKGDYYIEFRSVGAFSAFLINFWDITVVDCSGVQPIDKRGRVWSYNWAFFAINDFGFPNRPFNGSFYVCAPDPANPEAAFVTLVDFNGSGFRPAAFNVAFNSFGVSNTGNITTDRRSVQNANLTTAEYAIFLNDPIDLCETADIGDIELIGLSRCNIDEFCIKFSSTRIGQMDLLLDFDRMDGIYTPGSRDVLLTVNIDSAKAGRSMCLDWDGLDGLGQRVIESATTMVPIYISFAQGIYHFPIYDAELMTTGITIHSIRPSGPDPLIFYDDSNISKSSGTGEPNVQLTGCNVPCHGWTNYIHPDTVGFGNLNTINTWWFSRQTITENVFPLPYYLECDIMGPKKICPGSSDSLSVVHEFLPAQTAGGQIIAYEWKGPGMSGPIDRSSVSINREGQYEVNITWLTSVGDTCHSQCSFSVSEGTQGISYIDTLILRGDTVYFNNQPYFENGKYLQTITGSADCDSLIFITVRLSENILHYDFDDCRSFISDSSHQVYKEFTAKYPNALNCASMTAEFLHREMPVVNTHSCTPGVNDSPAMCVSSLDSCDYAPGHDKSIVFEVTLDPDPDTAIMITHLSFYERAPENFEWLHGPTGPNNYPTLYGIRVLKNGIEIFRVVDIPTTTAWSMESFDFRQLPDFASKEKAVYRFELLGYCLVGDTSKVTAWDMDELSVLAACVSPSVAGATISGTIKTDHDFAFPGVEVMLSRQKDRLSETTDSSGYFAFRHQGNGWFDLSATTQHDYLNGVSTADLLVLLDHLLGKDELSAPFDYIRADVDNSRSVSTADLIQIQKLILGRTSTFSTGTSWKIIRNDAELPLTSPWQHEDLITRRLTNSEDQVFDLLALKLGDVTDDAIHETTTNETRSPSTVGLSYVTGKTTVDGLVKVPFIINDDFSTRGFQIALDVGNAEFVDVSGKEFKIGTDAYYVDDSGVLNICLISPDEIQFKEGDILFSLLLRSTASHPDDIVLDIDDDRIKAEMYDAGLLGHRIQLARRHLQTDEVDGELSVRFYPNPFNRLINIELGAIDNDEVTVNLMRSDGLILFTQRFESTGASQSFRIDLSGQSDSQGLILYEVRSRDQVEYGRLIKF